MIIRRFIPTDVSPVFALQQQYAQIYPGTHVIPGEYYLSPAFHGGQDVFCALEGDRLLAYAPFYLQAVSEGPAELPHIAWVEIKADPALPDPRPIKDALYECLQARALESTGGLESRPLRMCFQYFPIESASIDYAQSKGFVYTKSVFAMGRDLSEPILNLHEPEGITLRHWKIESEADLQSYVAARNECYPEAPITPGEWQYFLGSPMMAVGTTVAAFAGDALAGCVTVYWNDKENAQSGQPAGYTEYIFVRPGWRGKGIAQAMITEGMRYLKERGMAWARLEVLAENEGALRVYQKLGFQVASESRFFAKMIR